jgi:peptide-methionine (S)-S-oxide reductase
MILNRFKDRLTSSADALPGRDAPAYAIPDTHEVLGTPIRPPFPETMQTAIFGLGCFWGAERLFWQMDGVYTTAVGYAGGVTPNPTYQEVCSGRTGHTEVVLVVFDPHKLSYESLLQTFFEAHDPTQGMRQGNDVGTQYRSAIYYTDDGHGRIAKAARNAYNATLVEKGFNEITTEIAPSGPFYYAEEYHQQYLHKIPHGYCNLAGTGVTCSIPSMAVSGASDVAETLKPLPSSEEEWKQILTPQEYAVLRQAGTERPFTGEYVDTDDEGMYSCRACGNPLFTSETKFDHGCGWPSFWDTVSQDAVEYVEDRSYGMVRTEVRCARCHSHLGHVFNDGPREHGGQRFCMNSISMDFQER